MGPQKSVKSGALEQSGTRTRVDESARTRRSKPIAEAVPHRNLVIRSDQYNFVFVVQAEDGIRDVAVTGVQTCALPICAGVRAPRPRVPDGPPGEPPPGHRGAPRRGTGKVHVAAGRGGGQSRVRARGDADKMRGAVGGPHRVPPALAPVRALLEEGIGRAYPGAVLAVLHRGERII